MSVKVHVYTETYLRTGGTRKGEDDRIGDGPIEAGWYEALGQSPCAEVVLDPTASHKIQNYWWVRIRTPRGDGWVSAVNVETGKNDKPIPPVDGVAVPQFQTVFAGTEDEHGPTVTVWRDTPFRRGGSTREPDNHIGQDYLPEGTYRALAQCAGEEVVDEENGYRNFWWVYLATDRGRGWVTAVDVASGGNDQPIPDVDGVPIPQRRTVMVV